ncbi:hypothetical protein TB2_038265 [Malus domestica]
MLRQMAAMAVISGFHSNKIWSGECDFVLDGGSGGLRDEQAASAAGLWFDAVVGVDFRQQQQEASATRLQRLTALAAQLQTCKAPASAFQQISAAPVVYNFLL